MRLPALQITVILLLVDLLTPFIAHAAQQLAPYTGDNKNFTLNDIKDRQHTLPDYEGKVVLVNFWASWCPPCIYEMPELKKLKKHYAGRPFEIVTINVGEKKYKVRKFAKLINLELPILLDTSSETFNVWGVKTLPSSFLIDSDGLIRYQVRGNPGWELEETINLIESMMPESSTPESTPTTSER